MLKAERAKTVSMDLGQNFLFHPEYLKQIIQAANLSQEDLVLEIGAGTGSLTQKIIEKAGLVYAVELDHNLVKGLKKRFQDSQNLKIIEGDFLKTDLNKLAASSELKKIKILGNLPYYITGKILRKIVDALPTMPLKHKPCLAIFVLQKEVGEKICNPKKNSILSLSIKAFGKPELCGFIPAEAFSPAPKVDSVILKIKFFREQKITTEEIALFFRLIKIGFSSPRKMLKNNLKNGFKLNEDKIKKWFSQANLEKSVRPESLSLQEWKNLLKTQPV